MKRKKLSPPEKKQLSYEKDCRNMIAESRSLSRLAIAKRRAMSHQSFRTSQKRIIKKLVSEENAEFEKIENQEKILKTKGWRKLSDKPLGNFVAVQLKERKKRGINTKLKISSLLLRSKLRSANQTCFGRWGYSKKDWENFVAPSLRKR